MGPGAPTPEDLESLLEDAFVLHDRRALTRLFGDGAVLVASPEHQLGTTERIDQVALRLWESGCVFVAEPRRVIQACDTALVVSDSTSPTGERTACGATRSRSCRSIRNSTGGSSDDE